MRSFIEVRNEQLRLGNTHLREWGTKEVWQKVAAKGEHEAWCDSGYGRVAYYNSITEFTDVQDYGDVARSADGRVLVLNQDYHQLPANLYVLAE